jgi:hypothetical protein
MARYRNVSALPLDNFPGGRQVLTQGEIELTDAEAADEKVAVHIEQRTLVAVTLATVPASARTASADNS